MTSGTRGGGYRIDEMRELIRESTPATAAVLVVGDGSDEPSAPGEGRRGQHVPADHRYAYLRSSPTNSGSAVVQLEAHRSRGFQFVAIPGRSGSRLEHYSGVHRHLERNYRLVASDGFGNEIYDVRYRPRATRSVVGQMALVLAAFESRHDKLPVVLDWESGIDLRAAFPEHTVFSPPESLHTLPYLDASVDIVVAHADAGPGTLAEARRVSSSVVVTRTKRRLDIELVGAMSTKASTAPSVSVIIPVYNGFEHTRACLVAVLETLPSDLDVEVVLVDDACTDRTANLLRTWERRGDRLRVIRNEQNQGFVASCNRGAKHARGELIVFLNNDTIPLPGWLQATLRTFRDHPDAGVVGGKLVFPDGRLQEAGGVVFSDGSATNLGRGAPDVDAPLFNYLRHVDYCSGAYLATPRSLFTDLGGFDVRYSPAYYEDTDYCFQVWSTGHRVYYQPESVIIHIDGASSASDQATGHKRYQAINTAKFSAKWATTLARQPDRPARFDIAAWHALAVRERRATLSPQ